MSGPGTTDLIWLSDNNLTRLDSTTDYKFSIQMILNNYIYQDTYAFTYFYVYSGIFNVNFQVQNLNQTVSITITVLTGK